jgi:hypothetical protein
MSACTCTPKQKSSGRWGKYCDAHHGYATRGPRKPALKKTKRLVGVSTRRIEVTLDITIPEDWTIGQTEEWLVRALGEHRAVWWEPQVEVGMQRSMKSALQLREKDPFR